MSEYTAESGMIASYKIRCQSYGCNMESDFGTPSRKECAAYARNHGWRYIRGAWYCATCAKERRDHE